MRADRLIQLVLLLQQRHGLSASELAEELGVSRRTIYRDVEALSLAGIPVYAEHGSEGGYRLGEGYRTSLNGLTREELGALLVLSFPAPLADLEIGQKLKSALLKLYASASSEQRYIYLDWSTPDRTFEPVPHLAALYRAVQGGYRVSIHYRFAGMVDITQTVEPYGLVAKGSAWYLIFSGSSRLHQRRVSELIDVAVCSERFERPPDFDLQAYWNNASAELEAETARFRTRLRVSPAMLRWLPHLLERTIPKVFDAQPDQWVTLELQFESFETARRQLLALGGAVEVLEPEALRLSLLDFATQILQVYTKGDL
jgi:predicted DNA-binding transcriptional regulator YafY